MFKRSAEKLKGFISNEAKGTSFDIVVNPGWNDTPRVRPRKGAFEVRVVKSGADPHVIESLTGMPRPFKKLRALDLEALGKRVAASLKGSHKAGAGAAKCEGEEDAAAPEGVVVEIEACKS